METKICYACKQEKLIIEFSKNKSKKSGLSDECKKCAIKKYNIWKKNNKEKFLNYQKEYNINRSDKKREDARKRRQIVKEFLYSYKKDKKCNICGYNKNTNTLVFHHFNPKEKEFKIAERNTSTPEILLKEIEKCILLCNNCHRELHWKKSQKNLKENVSLSTIKKRKHQIWFNEIKSNNGCNICGENKAFVLDCHHIDPKEKKYNLYKLVNSCRSKKLILEEFEKCKILCANCHQELKLF